MSLFKYRSLTDLKRVLDIIINKRLYGAKYLTLNDPMEGQFDFELSDDFQQDDLQKLFDERAKTLICSLSKTCNIDNIPNNGILWSMYADGHKGCCIEVEKDDSEWLEKQVYYADVPAIIDDKNVTIIDILTLKNRSWIYEDEVRFINTNPTSPYVKVKIKALYLGVKVTKEDVSFYTSLIHSIDKNIKVYQLKKEELNWTR